MNAIASSVPARATVADTPRGLLGDLLSRRSRWPLTEPAPGPHELDAIFDAALRAPDHGNLRPWRFVVIRGAARHAFGDLLVELADARAPDDPPGSHEHRRAKALAAPLIIALGAALNPTSKVPEIEQLLAVGAAAMNMLNAIHQLGYGGFWATGVDSYEPAMHDTLGFGADERLVGFLFVGTPATPANDTRRPDRDAHVREWLGPAR
ncbi:nitroreductase [Burkholderia thailandensis]|uniref:Putative NAD(P)H nitroreductase n=1 Tax=Burkholderia thailandensis (strain ATCC 700388 / DSM 13276 / CCUG 48851 / CIP 106301 / E264) TaxID=271848 RepID=Q2T3Y2_BURTA|nr:nitroreductase [Burkholderia thailandensis]ABC34843.1 nitroreductase family protein [Burkholderia thailandensis E264]AHI76247.1 nitroreductase family protein [Burkholderia thailandensis 2002721723]AIP28437.1 nitroreductase family protein [Burkholderia thailandensis E264]AIS99171.1 nitroreductase family protein [Burkholderia thailandensis MSMB59]AJY01073.1 nitroreductase family protein [Burkholderia thailandensis 2002721643]